MKRRIEVEVTAEDIKNGRPVQCTMCPVALAIERATEFGDVSVDSMDVYAGGECYEVPILAASFIDRFDCGQAVEPFKFVLS